MPRPEPAPEEIIYILHTSIATLRSMTNGLGEADLDWTASADDWSIRYVVAHLRAAEDVLGGQMMRIVEEDRPSWRRPARASTSGAPTTRARMSTTH